MPSPFFKREKKKKKNTMKNWNTLRNTRDKTMGRRVGGLRKGLFIVEDEKFSSWNTLAACIPDTYLILVAITATS